MRRVIFRLEGNILFAVLPFCILNCLQLGLVAYYREQFNFGFSPNGHGLLTLLVSFLVISKVNLAYDRYKAVRQYAGQGSMVLRELVQMAIAVSTTTISNYDGNINHHADDRAREIRQWRLECLAKVTDILDASVRVLQDRSLAKHFAFNKTLKAPLATTINDTRNNGCSESPAEETIVSDPLIHIQSLRLHLYCTPGLGLELLERVNLVTKLQEYTSSYNNLLILASTPLPFPLLQMGRAFLMIWTFSMPLVLLEGPFTDIWSAQAFLFFLTYGFIGLELVSIKLSDPFGNGRDNVQLSSIRDATIVGIENDLKEIPMIQATISERRLRFSQQKKNQQQQLDPHEQVNKDQDHHDQTYDYYAIAAGDVHLG